VELDFQKVSGFGPLDVDGTGQIVDLREVDVSNLVRIVVVRNLTAGPIKRLQTDRLAGLRFDDRRDVRVPPIERFGRRLLVRWFVDVDFEFYFWYVNTDLYVTYGY
jgi:hypothetical protein